MTSEDVRKFWIARPFRPFTLRLIDGRSFVIRHPDFIWSIPPSLRVVSLVDDLENTHVINTTIIVSIELFQPSPPPGPRTR